MIYCHPDRVAQATLGGSRESGSIPSPDLAMKILIVGQGENMSSKSVPLSEKLANSFTRLAVVANDLNTASNDLANVIGTVDAALKSLNLGIESWVTIHANED